MAEAEHASLFFFRYTPSNNLVRIILKEIWLFPEDVPYLGKEAILVLLCPFSG